MKLSLVKENDSTSYPIISIDGDCWYRVNDLSQDLSLTGIVDVLAYDKANPGILSEKINANKSNLTCVDISAVERVMPFQPLSYRDFMLFEKHCINATRGAIKKYLPKKLTIINFYEKITGKIFPKLKPKSLWYEYPIFYLGNHLNFITNGTTVEIPSYTRELDYELELGVVLCAPLKNATAEEAEKAIGGFVVFNDFSARDVQIKEMNSGFGPMKAKNFANSISNIVVSADEILPVIDKLKVSVSINGKEIAENNMGGMHYSLPEAIAYASWEEQLHAGEFFATGTVPGCCGLENGHLLNSGDSIKLEVEGVGSLENLVK